MTVLKTSAKFAVAALVICGFSFAATGPANAETESPQAAPAPAPVNEVGAYLYQKIDPALDAAWWNAGSQRLLLSQPGTEWIDEITGVLPDDVCGPGWAVQQDRVFLTGTFTWPQTVAYPEQFGNAAVLDDSKHEDLELYGTVPDCTP